MASGLKVDRSTEMYSQGVKASLLAQAIIFVVTAGEGLVAGRAIDAVMGILIRKFGGPAARALRPIIANLCFTKGTLIHTAKGLKPIEKVKKGDKVLSYNEQTKQFEFKAVVRTFISQSQEIVKIKARGENKLIEATPGHPFYARRAYQARDNTSAEDDDPDGEWIEAKNLQAGNFLKSANGRWVEITSIDTEYRQETVYNFEVEDNHNYFVGQSGVLVHNNCETTIALGLREGLDSFATKFGAKTWKELAPDPTLWKQWFMDAMSNSSNKIVFNLDGIDNVGTAVQRAAAGGGGATDWELLMIKQNSHWWDRIQFIKDGKVVANPFQ